MPSNWGMDFTVGAVPVFKYLESADVDEVGYTLRTASLMTGPEDHFDDRNPADYELFGIHYLILPAGSSPPVSAREVAVAGPYALWTTATPGYIHAGTIAGTLTADRTDLGARSIPLLGSGLAERGDYLEIVFGERRLTPPPLPEPSRGASAGTVTSESDDLEQGSVIATVTMRRPGVVVLSARSTTAGPPPSTVARSRRRWSRRRWSRPTSRPERTPSAFAIGGTPTTRSCSRCAR